MSLRFDYKYPTVTYIHITVTVLLIVDFNFYMLYTFFLFNLNTYITIIICELVVIEHVLVYSSKPRDIEVGQYY